MTLRRRLLIALGAGCALGFVHHVIEYMTWAMWDAAPTPGKPYPHPMPALWPLISFPVLTLYDLLTHDRDMFRTFETLMLGNSIVWGAAACGTLLVLLKRRRHTTA